MIVPSAYMLDTIGANAANIPTQTPYVGGYMTGVGDVPWGPSQWALFPHARRIRIDQGAGTPIPFSAFDVIDVETGAVTPAGAAARVEERVDGGIEWTGVYGTDSTLASVSEEIQRLGDHYWVSHVYYWLADWNLDVIAATNKLGTFIHGAACVGVQYASPASNPRTLVPGGTMTLAQANIDISVVDANWIPSGPYTGTAPTPPPPMTLHGVLVTYEPNGGYVARQVSSADDINWH